MIGFFTRAFTQSVPVSRFGAKGDGISDDTKALAKAMNYAVVNKKTLTMSAGVYLVSTLAINVNLAGVKNQTRIKKINNDNSNDIYNFCNIKNKNIISISNIIFDGSVKGSDTKPLLGGIPLFIYGSNSISIVDCMFVNSPSAGLRIETCSNMSIARCKTDNLNGPFGDGIYVENSNTVSLTNVASNNYTRIGFVIERNTRNVSFKYCTASNGYNASILHGGTEFNAGFWAESSANVSINNCSAKNNLHYGYVLTSGIDKKLLLNTGLVKFSISNSVSINCATAYRVSSSDNPVNIQLTNCKALAANQGFVALAKNKEDKFTFNNCVAEILEPSEKSLNDAGFMWESELKDLESFPTFAYQNCVTNFKGKIPYGKLHSNANNVADLSTYGGGNARIFIDKMSNNTSSKQPIIKAIKGNPRIEFTNTQPDLNYMNQKGQVIIK